MSARKQIQKYFKSYQLSREQRKKLNALQKDHVRALNRNKKQSGIQFAIAALAVSLLLFLGYQTYRKTERSPGLPDIASSLAYHHNKEMDMEFYKSDFEKLNQEFDKLSFRLIKPERLRSSEWKLVGGRYCSLAGRLAAQLSLKNKKTGKRYTLYEIPFPGHLGQKQMKKTFETYHNGAYVKVWKEKGLLLGLAGRKL